MGREARRVPKDWQHPKKENGSFKRLLDGAVFKRQLETWNKEKKAWAEGFWISGTGETLALNEEQKAMTYEEWSGSMPVPENYMPQWSDEERTHLMMYEDTSEGTPISPAFPTAEELARWLVDTGASVFADRTASYEAWMSIIRLSGNSFPFTS